MLRATLRQTLAGIGPVLMLALPLGCAPSVEAPPPQTAAPKETPESERASAAKTLTAAPKEIPESQRDAAAKTLTAPPDLLTAEQLAAGWISLFDGKTLFGWQAESKADWRVENGAIVASAGDPGLLRTTTQFSEYVLKFEFRCERGGDSGVFLQTAAQPRDPARDCYELNIADSNDPFPTGSLVQRKKATGRPDRDAWQACEAILAGGQVVVKLDGEEVLRYADQAPLGRGFVGLQFEKGKAQFRKIQLKPLALENLFNGKDLAGWKTYPGLASVFSATPEGLLNVKGGRGQLETEAQYGDFVMQLECMTHAPNLNSGVFFRCIAGEQMNGYEIQIHNGFRDGDRAKPVDCGTGGVFRRQNARLVAADDLTWFHQTIVAHGPHIAVWVNGLQVTDWTDDRPPDENPRKGLRLKPGTIMLQGHDPTTDISFRNLRAAELKPRQCEGNPKSEARNSKQAQDSKSK